MNYSKKKIVEKPLKTEWCLDQNDVDTLMLPEYKKDEIIYKAVSQEANK